MDPVKSKNITCLFSYNNILPFEPAGYGIGNFFGSSDDFEEMVIRCRAAGVGVIVNIVLNHFTRHGSQSSLGNPIHKPGPMDFPAVPYNASNFHQCDNKIESSWNTNCTGYGLDVKTESPECQEKIVEYLHNELVGGRNCLKNWAAT